MAAYITAFEFLQYAAPNGHPDAQDDAVIDGILTSVSAYIDAQTGRTFGASASTVKYFDVPGDRTIYFDTDCLTVTKVTNGNGVDVAAVDYQLLPLNGSPKYAIRLKQSSSVVWEGDADGDTEGVIAITGTWGWAATCPADVKQAVMMIASNLYKGRSGETQGAATVTGAGVVITPKDVPAVAKSIIDFYRRLI